jgi:murein DD-endopeptidase MepM/ murein hydrolase activator NlpD
MPPDAFPIVSDFGSRYTTFGGSRMNLPNPIHTGIDIQAPIGVPIVAMWKGSVAHSFLDKQVGNLVAVNHGRNPRGGQFRSVSTHLSQRFVEKDEEVDVGQIIGTVGTTGVLASGRVPHLHFNLYSKRYPWEGDLQRHNPHSRWRSGPGIVTLFRPTQVASFEDALDIRNTSNAHFLYPIPGKNDLAFFLNKLVSLKEVS